MVTDVGNRYQVLERIGAGGMGIVFRVLDRLTRETVALKQVLVGSNQLDFATLTTIKVTKTDSKVDFPLALAQEFRTLASLRHPHIISVLDYGFDEQRRPYFTMEYLESAQNLLDATRGLSQKERIQLLIQVAQALAYLHRRGVIHRDLKPENVLVHNGIVKVLDFGLAISRDVKDHQDNVVGTLAYIAPEVLSGGLASVASDLYSFGMIAYEVLTGEHPFDLKSINTLLQQIMHEMPDFSGLDAEAGLISMLKRLLDKDPEKRFQNGQELITSLGQLVAIESIESKSVRESYLQAADFIGREAEMRQLRGMLNQLISKNGSALLIGGESGVGKSRLLDELRAVALVRGAQVMGGQAVMDVGTPFQMWRDILRLLVLQTPLTEFEAGILKFLIPDIRNLVDFDVPDVPELDPNATQLRFLTLIEEIFRRQKRPIVLLLEDLQWAGQSLRLLERLVPIVHELPLLILGTYRNDDAPQLPAQLPDMPVMVLDRLKRESIEALSVSMLGDSAGRNHAVLNLIEQETEGNVFFIVEVVRALAEEAGQLDNIANRPLPNRVFAEGIQSIIRRRLERVSLEHQQLLQIAAVAGRELDLPVIEKTVTEISIQDWLAACADASVLTVQDDRWRFAHDKLREGVLADLPAGQRVEWHARIAHAIEEVYPGVPDQYGILAYHWREANNIEKDIHYAVLAGKQAFSKAGYEDAERYFERALTFADTVNMPVIERAQIYGRLGEIAYVNGDGDQSIEFFAEGLKLLDEPLPQTSAQINLAILKQFAIQFMHLVRKPRALSHTEGGRYLTLAYLYRELAPSLYWRRRAKLLLYSALASLNAVEHVELSVDLLIAKANASATLGIGLAWHRVAAFYARQADEALQEINDPFANAWVSRSLLNYAIGQGDWPKLTARLEDALRIARETIDYRYLGDLLTHYGNKCLYDGNFEAGYSAVKELRQVAERSGNTQHERWGLFATLGYFTLFGRYDEARVLAEEQLQLYQTSGRNVPRGFLLSLATIANRTGNLASAREYTLQVAQGLDRTQERIYAVTITYAEHAEASLYLFEQQPDDVQLKQVSQQVLKLLRKSMKFFKVAEPKYLLFSGWYEVIIGNREKGIRLLEKAQKRASMMHMPFYEGLAHYQLARFLPANHPSRQEHIQQSKALFEALKVPYYSQCVAELDA